jgi:hypothetical protein
MLPEAAMAAARAMEMPFFEPRGAPPAFDMVDLSLGSLDKARQGPPSNRNCLEVVPLSTARFDRPEARIVPINRVDSGGLAGIFADSRMLETRRIPEPWRQGTSDIADTAASPCTSCRNGIGATTWLSSVGDTGWRAAVRRLFLRKAHGQWTLDLGDCDVGPDRRGESAGAGRGKGAAYVFVAAPVVPAVGAKGPFLAALLLLAGVLATTKRRRGVDIVAACVRSTPSVPPDGRDPENRVRRVFRPATRAGP